MGIYLGNNKYSDIYLGSAKISEIYLGSDKVFAAASVPPPSMWTCWNCGHENPDSTDYCEECGEYKEEGGDVVIDWDD